MKVTLFSNKKTLFYSTHLIKNVLLIYRHIKPIMIPLTPFSNHNIATALYSFLSPHLFLKTYFYTQQSQTQVDFFLKISSSPHQGFMFFYANLFLSFPPPPSHPHCYNVIISI